MGVASKMQKQAILMTRVRAKKDAEISSESDASTTCIGSLFGSDEIEDA